VKMTAWAELVIVDFHMPSIDGAALLPALKDAASSESPCFFYMYTSDPEVARKYDTYGFDGGFLRKGDEKALGPQVEAAFRTIHLRKLAGSLRAGRSHTSTPPKA
jgi:DNA-binding NarL/FixJ family response regulator